MSERDEALAAIRVAAGGIDPVIDQAQDYARGVLAVQRVVRQQGQVLSLALQNNHVLYHTNKSLVTAKRELEAVERTLNGTIESLRGQLEAQARHIERLEASGGDKWRLLYEDAKRTIDSWVGDNLDFEGLKAAQKRLAEQAGDLRALPETLTPEQILESVGGDTEAGSRPGSPFYVPQK